MVSDFLCQTHLGKFIFSEDLGKFMFSFGSWHHNYCIRLRKGAPFMEDTRITTEHQVAGSSSPWEVVQDEDEE
jgi:hypothetical protein